MEHNGTNWVVADTSTTWYDYSNQEWANAVLLRSGVSKSVGQTVTVEGSNPEAVAMFVWIPRYEYKIEGQYGTHSNAYNVVVKDEAGNTSSATYGAGTQALPGEIEVKFIAKTKTEADTGYILHPAFIFGTQQLDGIWVGKFETHHPELSSSTTNNNLGCTTTSCDSALKLRILPNVPSLRWNNVSNMFYAARSMQSKLGITGFDSHMAKNSEWGAAAYLSQSKYGIYGNTGKEVAQNTNSDYLTGGGNYTSNTAQSTTGNITGIYDMSGGTWKFVMGVYNKTTGSSGLTVTSIDEKYYDNYTTTDPLTACNGGICYGHALSETSGWYNDATTLVSSSYPWMRRGGHYSDGADAGVFYFNYNTGGSNPNLSFRVVLAQTT